MNLFSNLSQQPQQPQQSQQPQQPSATNPWDVLGGMGGVGGMPNIDLNSMSQMLQNPAMQGMMQQLFSNPEMVQQVLNFPKKKFIIISSPTPIRCCNK